MMKAIIQIRYGSSDVLEFRASTNQARDDQMLVLRPDEPCHPVTVTLQSPS